MLQILNSFFFKMRAQVWCVLFCVLGTLALGEESVGELVLREMCLLKCPPGLYHGAWNDRWCYKNCIEGPQIFEESMNEEAEANATLVCRDVDFIVLGHNPGVFVIDRRPVGDTNWSKAAVIREPTTYMRKLVPGKLYEYRIRRILASGLSKPEITEPIATFARDFRNLRKIRNVSISEFETEAEDPHHLKIDLSFSPSEEMKINSSFLFNFEIDVKYVAIDQSCFYEATLRDDDNRYTLMSFNETMELRTTYGNLEFEREYIIQIRTLTTSGIASPKATKEFTTPTCRDFHKNLTLCPPATVTGLNATMICREENIFDVTVTWETPNLIPDFYEIHLGEINAKDPEFRNVSGNRTKVIFPVVKIVGMAELSITAVSPGGASETIYEHLKKPEASATFLTNWI